MPSNAIKTDSGIPVKRVHKKKDFQNPICLMKNQANFRIHAACILTCIGNACGQCDSTADSEVPKRLITDSNFLLEHGQTGLSLAFDLPTQTGRDSDDPQSEGEVGRDRSSN